MGGGSELITDGISPATTVPPRLPDGRDVDQERAAQVVNEIAAFVRRLPLRHTGTVGRVAVSLDDDRDLVLHVIVVERPAVRW